MPDIATVSYYVMPLITAAGAYLVARTTKHHEARAAAESALISAGPAIISDLNVIIEADRRRIDTLSGNIDKLWDELRKVRTAEQACRDELYSLKRRLGVADEE